MIGLIGAMETEMQGLIEKVENPKETKQGLDTFVSGSLFGQEAVLAVCGPGKINAALCAQSMILLFHPEWIVNLGVAGAGSDDVCIGDMVIATAAVQHDMDTTKLGDAPGYVSKVGVVEFPCDPGLRARLVRATGYVDGLQVHTGLIATGDQFVSDWSRRQWIHDQFGCLAIEMEGAAVAHACLVHGVPCGIIRSISDQADGAAEMDYPTFSRLAAAQAQQVMAHMLGGSL